MDKADESLLLRAIIFQLCQILRAKKFPYNKFLTEIKVMKITYDVINKLNLPITHSWYLRGCYIYSPTEEDSHLLDPKLWDKEIDQEEINSLESSNKELFTQVKSQIVKFLDDTDVLTTKKYNFLEYVYKNYAPERYRSIYLTNNKLLRLLENSIDELIVSFNSGASIFRFEDLNVSILDRFSPIISEFHLILSNQEEFEVEYGAICDFFSLLEEILIKFNCNMRELTCIPKETTEFFRWLSYDIYYKNIWKLIALKISQNTIKGIRSNFIKRMQNKQHNKLMNELPKIIDAVRNNALKVGLIPTHKEYETFFASRYYVSQELRKELSKIL